MTPKQCNADVLTPALALLPVKMRSNSARVMLLAIGLQESELRYRRQIRGPARSLWQMEQTGGVFGVLAHRASRALAFTVCEARGIPPETIPVYQAIEHDDVLAAAFARLLLWTDALPLPDDVSPAWHCYIRTWRPGKPHPLKWPRNWRLASEVFEEPR